MYHTIVKRIALKNFLRVNQKDYTSILKGVPHVFIIDLAGIMHSAASGTIVKR